jgi:hypothetical protein
MKARINGTIQIIKGKTTRTAVLIITVHLTFLTILASCTKQPAEKKTWEQAQAEVFQIIATRDEWPNSPEAVCKVFWEARRTQNYKEMEILWAGSGSWEPNWAEICKDDADVRYVFGKANEAGTEVPYAAEKYFKEHGSYNLTMRLSSLQTKKGRRYYIWSGN